MGRHLVDRYRAAGREVVTVGRAGADVAWGDTAGLSAAVDGAALVIGLAGRTVNCRYTPANLAEMMSSRVKTTRALSDAIAAAAQPPLLWANASTATIYRHAEDRPMTEADGDIGRGYSIEVATRWEQELFAAELPGTRRVALRTSIVLGAEGGALPPLTLLARLGLGGSQHDGWWPVTHARLKAGTQHRRGSGHGRQRYSWIHIDDVARVIDFLEEHPELEGPVNVTAPNPVENREFMRTVRRVLGVPFGPPAPRWALEIGAFAMRTETELLLKSRWVLPERLTEAGFEFEYPELEPALRQALGR